MPQCTKQLHTLTHFLIDTLECAYQECPREPMQGKLVEGKILSAIVAVKQVHDMLGCVEVSESSDPEEYCAAV